MGSKDATQHGELIPESPSLDTNSTDAYAFDTLNFDQET